MTHEVLWSLSRVSALQTQMFTDVANEHNILIPVILINLSFVTDVQLSLLIYVNVISYCLEILLVLQQKNNI